MTAYGGEIITYDALGNPTSYNGTSYVWEGRQLKEVTNAEGKTQFEYDANGLRTQKRIFDTTGKLKFIANYIWENGVISSQTLIVARYNLDGTSASDIVFSSKVIYDKNNQPVGYIVNNDAVYMFVRNLQGDVIALIDDEGDTMLEYSYDPWGKLEYKFTNPNMDETAAMFLTSLCPLTYRGYNYDFSTGLYYLQSRYYNPEWGRLVNTDDPQMVLNTIGDDHGANQFAYSMNNPINYSDHSGYWGEDVHNGWFEEPIEKDGFYALPCYYNGFIGNVPHHYNEKSGRGSFYGTFYWAIDTGFLYSDARIIAFESNDIDKKFKPWIPTRENQAFHFNVSRAGQTDSRLEIAIILLVCAISYFSQAEHAQKYSSEYYRLRKIGLQLLGSLLHPLQDFDAHTDDRVYTGYVKVGPLIYPIKSHIRPNDDTDSVALRWGQLQKTEMITRFILELIYVNYKSLFRGSNI